MPIPDRPHDEITATDAKDGYNSIRPKSCAPLAEILKLNGFSTAHGNGATKLRKET